MKTIHRGVFAVYAFLLVPSWVFGLGAGEPIMSSIRGRLPPVTREYAEREEVDRYDDLLAEFGRDKELPEGYELQALIALSHFPQLKDIRIRFVQDDVSIPISSRPRAISSLRRAEKRLYLVVIDTQMTTSGRDALLLKNQPFNAQIGILGHELAHTAWYINRSTFGVLADALCQLSRSCRVDFERSTDRRLIDHGLGWQRYDHSAFVRAGFSAAGIQSDGAGGAYMDPPELLDIMKEDPRYLIDQ